MVTIEDLIEMTDEAYVDIIECSRSLEECVDAILVQTATQGYLRFHGAIVPLNGVPWDHVEVESLRKKYTAVGYHVDFITTPGHMVLTIPEKNWK